MLTLDENFQKSNKQLTEQLIKSAIDNDKALMVDAIAKGAYVNSFNDYQTPIMACVEYDNIELARLLLKFNANPSIMVGTYDAIWLALTNKNINFINLFFNYNKKFKMNTLKENAKTLLIYATEESYLEAVKIIAYKVNVNQKDSLGNTALAYNLAKENPSADDIEICKILLACGADKNSVNLDGIEAKDMAKSMVANSLLEKHTIETELDNEDINNNIENNPEIAPVNITTPKKPFKI